MWWWIGIGGALALFGAGLVLGMAGGPFAPPPPAPRAEMWAVYDGFGTGRGFQPTTLLLFDLEDVAADAAQRRGCWVAPIELGDVHAQLSRAVRAPRVPWSPLEEPP